MRRTILSLAILPLLLLAACGTRGAPAPAAPEHAEIAVAQAPSLAPEPADERITAVDAAIGDGAGLPEDRYGPSDYDLARRDAADRLRSAAAAPRERAAAAIAPAGTSTTELLHADDTVTTGV